MAETATSALACLPSVSSQVCRRRTSRIGYKSCTEIQHSIIGRGLTLPPGIHVPEVVQKALDAGAPPRRSTSNRDSMQRKRNWWLPYVVLEFDKNEVLVDALGGDLSKPEWNYRADLCASLPFLNISGSAD